MPPHTQFTKAQAVPAEATYDSTNLKGKSAIITGGASGIGEVVMRGFVQAGVFVTYGDVNEDRGKLLASELGDDKVAFVKCDVNSWTDQLKLFKTALDKSPSKTIDIVVANAGIGSPDDVFNHEVDESGEPKQPEMLVLKTNLIGVVYTLKLALFYLPKQPEGEERDRCIIMTASMSGYYDHAGSPQYNSSKWGVRGLFRSTRSSGPAQGIRVNLIAPWFLDTRIMPEEFKAFIRSSGVEFASLEDSAAAYLHLASDTSLNGRAFNIVPRSLHPRGYHDMQKDDAYDSEDILGKLQGSISPAKQKAAPQ